MGPTYRLVDLIGSALTDDGWMELEPVCVLHPNNPRKGDEQEMLRC